MADYQDCCQYCGGTSGVVEVTQVSGPWKRYWTWEGEITQTDIEGLKHGPVPKTVTCQDCGKRFPNPHLKKGKR